MLRRQRPPDKQQLGDDDVADLRIHRSDHAVTMRMPRDRR